MRPRILLKPVLDGAIVTRNAQTPVILRKQTVDEWMQGEIPALSRWFETLGQGKKKLGTYWNAYHDTMMQMELKQNVEPRFSRFEAPMGLFLNWQAAKFSQVEGADNSMALYIAQTSLSSLPASLQDDVPAPELVTNADVYGSSLWLGIPPTHTPLHRDPNDNLFVQLCGTKFFRLLKPKDGAEVIGGRRMRMEEEMMVGEAANEVEQWLWNEQLDGDDADLICYEAKVKGNEGLYIPRGWWHSVRGVGKGINASVNWWYR